MKHTTYLDNVRTRKEAEALARAGHEVDIISLVDGKHNTAPKETVNGVTIYRIPVRHMRKGLVRYIYEYTLALILFAWTLTRLHLRRRYDVISIANMPDTHIFAALIPKVMGARIVADWHECMPEIYVMKYGLSAHHPAIRAMMFVERAALGFADHVITCNEEMKRTFVTRGTPAHKISWILNTPYQEEFRPAENLVAKTDDSFVLITHGSIEERYGIDIAVRAMAIVRRAVPGARLEIFGKGTALDGLVALTKELGLEETVVFRGFVPMEDLVRAVQEADAGLVTVLQNSAMRWVNTSKMFEYVATGKPVIISRSPAVEDYFDNTCMAFFDNNDPNDLARVIVGLYHNAEQRHVLAQNAARTYEQLKWSVESIRYCRLIESLHEQTMRQHPATTS
jgi:glycosyltransferase involved in cell wall biosynthesis